MAEGVQRLVHVNQRLAEIIAQRPAVVGVGRDLPDNLSSPAERILATLFTPSMAFGWRSNGQDGLKRPHPFDASSSSSLFP